MHLLALLGPFTDPIKNEPPRIGHYREYSRPPPRLSRILRTHARQSYAAMEKFTLRARNFYVRTCVKFTLANKIETMHDRLIVTRLLV